LDSPPESAALAKKKLGREEKAISEFAS